jgi:hypothetical protein
MKKISFIIFIFINALFARTELFDYDMWAKDLETMIKLNEAIDNSIEGTDSNHNLVRDDVENYIKKKYADDEFQKIMFLEAAKKIQQIITLPNNSTLKAHKILDKELLQIYTCRDFILFKHGDTNNIEDEIKNKIEFKSKVLNTSKRLNAYIKHKRMLPLKYSIPDDKELKRQKDACEKLYSKITNENKKLKTLTIK